MLSNQQFHCYSANNQVNKDIWTEDGRVVSNGEKLHLKCLRTQDWLNKVKYTSVMILYLFMTQSSTP